jgi:hypothetical protein
MSFLLQCLALIETFWSWTCRVANSWRARVLVPNTIRAGYSMILTPAGYWTPLISRESQVDCPILYDAAAHRIMDTTLPILTVTWKRCDWIGAVGRNGVDYGEFLASLRIQSGASVTPAQIIALAVHQTGRWPGGLTLRATTRMGEEIDVNVVNGLRQGTASERTAEEINYIR